jgi:LysR family hydrogen peroxide-inducible transcriptional activator
VEINQLRYFLMVVERGSFSKAALHCYISQPALSEQIQRLEDEVGAVLLDRSRRNIVPTAAGGIFIAHAREVLGQLAQAGKKIQDLLGTHTGEVMLGVLPTIAPYLLRHILESFAPRCSRVAVNIHEDMTATLLRLIESGKVDLGIMCLPIKEQGFEVEELFSEDLLVALPANHPLAGASQINLNDLRSDPFILMHDGHYLGDQVLGFCQRHDFRPRVVIRSGQLETVQSLVGAGLGVSFVPRMAILNPVGNVQYCSLRYPRPRRTIAIVWRSRNPPTKAVLEFLNHLRKTGKTFRPSAFLNAPSEQPKAI